MQRTEARFISNFGWGLTKRIESHSLARFKANVQRVSNVCIIADAMLTESIQSREGVSLILGLIRQARTQAMALGGSSSSFIDSHRYSSGWDTPSSSGEFSPPLSQ